MKLNEKGITLTALVIYVTVMFAVITTISTIATYTYKNMNNLGEEGQYAVEINKFDMYFLRDIKKAEKISASGDTITIRYKDEDENDCNIIYSKSNKNITRDDGKAKINICKNVTECSFTISQKNVKVVLKINNEFVKDMDYIAENLTENET